VTPSRLGRFLAWVIPWFDTTEARARQERTRVVVERSKKVRIDAARAIREFEEAEREFSK
jgi:hypothetical protein